MTETPQFIDTPGGRLFGIWHDPGGSAPRVPFVFCHPLAEEKLWTHRVFVSFARQLAIDGYPVLRFDCRGNGDSDGTFEASSLTTLVADTNAAIDHARRTTGAPAVHLLGLRLGATVASLVAAERRDVQQLILWAPIVDGARYMQELLRVNLAGQMAQHKEVRQDRAELVQVMEAGGSVNIDGYELRHQLFSEVSAVHLARQSRRHDGPTLVVSVVPRGARAQSEIMELATQHAGGRAEVAEEEPFWKEIQRFYGRADHLFDVTRRWQAALPRTRP